MRTIKDIIFIWNGANGSIPSGFAREAALDGVFPKGTGAGVNPNVSGGNATHQHTSPTHSHSIEPHTHTVSLNASTAGGNSTGDTSSGGPTSNHGHQSVNSGAVVGGGLDAVAATYASVNSEPLHKKVIFIKADGSRAIPDGVIGLFNKTTLPNDWDVCDGLNSTPDYDGYFLKGAAAGQDADASEAGAATHQHTISHTHNESAHSHARVQSGNYTATTDFETASGTADSVQSHSHDIDLNGGTIGYSGTPTSGAVSNEPLYKKLLAIQNNTGADSFPKDIIGIWLGALDAIPVGWDLVTQMQGYHLKITANPTEIHATGGANTHTHSDSHSHTGGSHNHTATVEVQAATNNLLNSGHSLPKPHGHTAVVGSTNANFQSANTTGNSSNHEPPFKTVAFIKYSGINRGGLFFL